MTSWVTFNPQLCPRTLFVALLVFLPLVAADTHFTGEPGSSQIVGDPDVYGIVYDGDFTFNSPHLVSASLAIGQTTLRKLEARSRYNAFGIVVLIEFLAVLTTLYKSNGLSDSF